MPKYFIFALVTVALFVSLARENKSAANNAARLAPRDNIEIIILSEREIIIPCKKGYAAAESCSDKATINVSVRGNASPDGEESEIKYKVSGGRVIGKGKDVIWDLFGVKPGTYFITADFIDYKNKKITETKAITVRNCNCPGDCFCPTISMTGNRQVKAGEPITFKANVSGGTAGDVTYDWTISQGEIVDGQGTAQIKVKTTSEMAGSNITATVEISGGSLCADCPRTTMKLVEIIK